MPIKINLAKSSGFCFGVKRALQIASASAQTEKALYMLGEIVHNEDVVKQIKTSGIKKIKRLTRGKGKTLLIRAHGASAKTLTKARALGYKIVDATCPMVKEIHKIALKAERQGYKIIVIGDKKHDEVQGIVGQLKTKALVIDSPESIPFSTVKKIKKAAIVVQSTQNIDQVLKIAPVLKRWIKTVKFSNTICRPTRTKQEEIKKMPRENEAMVIIGSKTSANTKRLYQISKSLNKNSYWVNSKKELKPHWFRNVKTVGVTAGASTPEATTKAVIKRINSFKLSLQKH